MFGEHFWVLSVRSECVSCVFVSVDPHILCLQQLLAAFIAAGVRCHFRVDTGVISAGQDGHWHAGVNRAFQLMGNLSYLFMCPSAKVDFRNICFAIFAFVLRTLFS